MTSYLPTRDVTYTVTMVAKASSGTYVFPDGGWGWVVLAAVTFHQILLPMVYATFGIFLLEFLDVYDVKPSTLTWIGALQASLMGFSGENIHTDELKLSARGSLLDVRI